FFATILAYLQSPFAPKHEGDKEQLPYYFAALALFLAAVLSKTIACSAPAVILLLMWWKRGRVTRRDVLATLPMFVVGLVMAWFTSWIERNWVRSPEMSLTLAQRILVAGNAVW